MEYRKVCVEILARFLKDGGIRPVTVVWADGRRFEIDKLKFIEPAPSRVSAVMPVRYTCLIGGEERKLYYEPDFERWFVEVITAREEID